MSDPNKYTDAYLDEDEGPILDSHDYAKSSYSETDDYNMGGDFESRDADKDDFSNVWSQDSGDYTTEE